MPDFATNTQDHEGNGLGFGELVAKITEDARYEAAEEQDKANRQAVRHARARAYAEQLLADENMQVYRAARVKRTAREFAAEPRGVAVMDRILAAEVNLLGGPSAAGKSLLARDLALHVATGEPWMGYQVPEARQVLWIASEGMHDFDERWGSQPLWEQARDRVWVLDSPLSLTSESDVSWLLEEYREERPGLVVLDLIYGSMADDNGTKDTLPVLAALKRISAAFGGATLAVGHNGHNGERRFRGSSAWRQLAAVEWHAGDGRLSCEKSKIANATAMEMHYELGYPHLHWVSAVAAASAKHVAREAKIVEIIRVLDSLGLPISAGKVICRDGLKDEGVSVANDVLEAALRRRKKGIKP